MLFPDLRTPDPRHTGIAAALVTLKHGLKVCDFGIHSCSLLTDQYYTFRPAYRKATERERLNGKHVKITDCHRRVASVWPNRRSVWIAMTQARIELWTDISASSPSPSALLQILITALCIYPTFPLDFSMRICVIAGFVALAAAHAPFKHPSWTPQPHSPNNATQPQHGSATCISASDASLIATSFGLTISNYTEALAVQLFTNDFTDQSDSVNTLIHEPGLQAKDVSIQASSRHTARNANRVSAWIFDLRIKSRLPRRPRSPASGPLQDSKPLEHL